MICMDYFCSSTITNFHIHRVLHRHHSFLPIWGLVCHPKTSITKHYHPFEMNIHKIFDHESAFWLAAEESRFDLTISFNFA